MSRFLGDKYDDAVDACGGPPSEDDVFTVITDPVTLGKKVVWQKAGTNNVANAAINTAKLADNAVATAKLADSAVATAKLADGAITTTKVASKALTNDHLTNDIVQGHGLLNKFFGASNSAVTAPAGFAMVGGAVFGTDVFKNTTTHRAGAHALTFSANCPTTYGFETELTPVREGEFVEGIYGFQASGTTVAAAAELTFYQFDKTTQVGARDDIYRGAAGAASTKYTKRFARSVPSNARFVKARVTITVQHATETLTVDTLNIVSTPFGGFTGIMPIGSIIAWHKSLPAVPSLPTGWVECNGQSLSDKDSALDGQTIPDLNGSTGALYENNRFLRGATTSGSLRNDNVRTHKHSDTFSVSPSSHAHNQRVINSGSGGTSWADGCAAGTPSTAGATTFTSLSIIGAVENPTGTGTGGTPDQTYPRHMDVVWIMRVK